MAGRFDTWHHLKVRGDRTLATRYLTEGRKWLGFLLEQQALGGQQQVLEKTNSDGVVFRAELSGTQPILTIDVLNAKKKSIIPQILEGFIVRPSEAPDQYLNSDKNHVLLQPMGGTSFRPWFFDDAHTPEDFEGAQQYGSIFPDGIGRYGNVDWRNADQSIVLSWFGPSARYFGYQAGFYSTEPYVYLHGQLLCDVNDIDYDLFLELYPAGVDDELRVRGACIRKSDLIVIVHDESSMEAVVRIPLTSEMKIKAQGAGFDASVALFADVTANAGSAEVLLVYDSDGATTGSHPYFFNTAGTEARRIYYDFGLDYAVEARIYSVTEPGGETAWFHSESGNEVTAVQTWTADRSWSVPGNYDITIYDETPDGGDGDAHDAHTVGGPYRCAWDTSFDEEAYAYEGPISSSTITFTNTPSAERQKLAVDFRGSAWVYAYEYLGEVNNTSTYTNDCDVTMNVHRGYYSDDGGTPAVFDGEPTEDTWSMTQTISGTEVFNDRDGGIQTDFLTLTHGTYRTNNISYAVAQTGHYLNPESTFFTGSPPFDTLQETHITESASYTRTQTTTETDANLEYLDLRFRIAYYQVREEVSTLEITGAISGTRDVTFPDSSTQDIAVTGTMGFSLFGIPRETTEQVTWTTRLIVEGSLIDQITQVDAPTTGADTVDINMVSGGLEDFLTHWLQLPGYSPTPPTAQIIETTMAATLGFQMPSTNVHLPWHAYYVMLDGPGGTTGSDPLEYLDENPPITASFLTPSPGMTEITSDWSDSNQEVAGSWPIVKARYVMDYQNPGERNGENQFAQFSTFNLAALMAAYPDAVRLYPVGYVSTVIAAIEGPTGTVRLVN